MQGSASLGLDCSGAPLCLTRRKSVIPKAGRRNKWVKECTNRRVDGQTEGGRKGGRNHAGIAHSWCWENRGTVDASPAPHRASVTPVLPRPCPPLPSHRVTRPGTAMAPAPPGPGPRPLRLAVRSDGNDFGKCRPLPSPSLAPTQRPSVLTAVGGGGTARGPAEGEWEGRAQNLRKWLQKRHGADFIFRADFSSQRS